MLTPSLDAMTPEDRAEVVEILSQMEAVADLKRLEEDFAYYCREAWKVIEPAVDLVWSWHYDVICEWLTLAARGECRRLIVNVPPRTAKSSLITIIWPTWVWTRNPSECLLGASYATPLALEHSVKRRMLLESQWYQSRWGDKVKLLSDQNEKSKYRNSAMGQMAATSTEGMATGFGGSILILDDGMSVQQAASDAERAAKISWVANVWWSRFNDPSTGTAIIVEQRTHMEDITGVELSKGGWKHLCFPLESEGVEQEDGRLVQEKHVGPISGKIWERQKGEVLMPDRYPERVLRTLRSSPMLYATQYQQRPAPMGGNIIQREWIRYFGGKDPETQIEDPPMPAKFDRVLVSVDASFKEGSNNDPVALAVVGTAGPQRYLLDMVNGRMDEIKTEKEILRLRAKWNADTVLVEDKANGPVIIRRLKRLISGVYAVNPEGGKIARLIGCSAEWAAGDWHVPRHAPWTHSFIEQLLVFPNGKHDDMVDTMTQAAVWLASDTFGFLEFWKEQAKKEGDGRVVTIEDMYQAQKEEVGFMPRGVPKLSLKVNAPSGKPFSGDDTASDYSSPKSNMPVMGKVARANNTEGCPNCGGNFFSTLGKENIHRCNGCRHQWKAA